MKDNTVTTNTPCAETPLAIIGIGCLFPQAADQNAYWATIREGVDAISEIPATHWRVEEYFSPDQKTPDHTYGRRGGFIAPVPFNPMEFNIPPNTLEAIDTSQLLGLVAAGQALKDAGYGADREYDRRRVSVILGVTGTLELVIPLGARLGHPIWRNALKDAGVDETTAEDVVQRISDAYVPWQENSFPGLLGNVVAGRISKQYDLGGTNCVVDAACASSFSALHLAGMELATGKADMVVTGGIDTFNDIFMYMCFSKTPALSPTGNAKPFDASGDGTILGEGLGIVVIKRLADAERDNDRIYAVIRGVGSSSDGKGDAIYAPSASGQKKALLDAYSRAGVTPRSIGMVEAHGTGTRVGDAVEVSALREIYGEADRPWCALGSVKSQIGHTKAAAGSAGLIKAALSLHHKVLPPTIKVTQPLEEITAGKTPFYLTTTKRPWISSGGAPRRAAVSAFGFGGSNFHAVLEEYEPVKKTADWDGTVQILPFSAADAGELEKALAEFPTDLAPADLRSRGAFLRREFRPDAPCRLCLVVELAKTNYAAQIANARTQLRKNPATPWQTPDGIFFATNDHRGKLAILFPGQGAQYAGMLRDLACTFPEVFSVLAAADNDFGLTGDGRLSDLVYPPSSFGAADAERREELLRATDVAQPAIGAVSLGAFRLLQSFGIEPDATAGHSYGELTALCAAGRLDEASFHRLSRLRGRLMAEGTGDRGSMLAVSAPLEVVARVLAEEGLDLVIANRNAPSQAVLSGKSTEVDRADILFSSRNLACKRLPVAAAFHSPLVADAAEPFLRALADIGISDSSLPVYANTTAAPYPAVPDDARQLLAGQLARPVEFVAEIEAMYADGIRTFVEVGPGGRLTGLVKAILGDRDHQALALDASAGKRSGIVDLARILSQLAVLGLDIQLPRWDGDFQPPVETNIRKPLMTVDLCGANYTKPRTKRPPVPPRAQAPAGQSMPAPVSASPAPVPVSSVPALAESLRITRESMAILQKMQEETAQLHRRFLEGQETAARTIQSLLEQQRQLSTGSVHSPLSAAAPVFTHPAAPDLPAATCLPTAAAVIPPPQLSAPSAIAEVPVTARTAGTLLAVVSEKTGYPVEMLELEMGLDADLGIDSIKRVEILSAIQEQLPGAPVIGPEHLGTLQTLGEIAAFLGAGETSAQVVRPGETAATLLPSPASDAGVAQTLLAVVSEKTGYPVEMLELEMGLDADLGIDSIKRVEILSAIQEQLPGAPVIGPEHLGTLQTLGEIAAFLGAGTPATASATAAPLPVPTGASAAGTDIAGLLLQVVSEKTGYPGEMLELEMGLDADLGIDSIKRVEILSAIQERLPGAPVIGPEHMGSLRTLGEIAHHLAGTPSVTPAAAPEVSQTTARPEQSGPVSVIRRSGLVALPLGDAAEKPLTLVRDGEFWLADDASPFTAELYSALVERGVSVRLVRPQGFDEISAPEKIAGLVIIAPQEGTSDLFLENAFSLLQCAAPGLRRAAEAGGALFATVSRLDGSFGCGGGTTLADPLSGGLAGLAKTAAHEWPEVACKAVDLGDFPSSTRAVTALTDELLFQGPVEVGLTPGGRTAPGLAELPPAPVPAELPLCEGDMVVITGGGRGVTAAAAVALARACRPFLVLLGRSPEPVPEPEWLVDITDESRIKRALLEHAGKKLHPREIEQQFMDIVAGRELRDTLERIAAAGARGIYRSVDIRNLVEVAALLTDLRREHGPVKGLIHGAGVLADRLIVDKTREQFAQVYSTKVEGLRALLLATTTDDLRVLALFSSTTGRLGRTGQLDYAVANEVLNKLAQTEARLRPGCRTVSINWGPWDGGMVTPSLKKVFAGEGVGLIGLDEGGDFLVREIAAVDGPVEVIALAENQGSATAAQHSSRTRSLTETFAKTLTVDNYPFLRSHVLDGKAVLPMAMIMEMLAHGALHGNPGLRFHGFNDMRICKGVVLDAQTPCNLKVMAGRAEKRESFFVVPVELQSIHPEGRSILNARADIVLTTRLPEGIRSISELPATPYVPHNGVIYTRERLFHGPDLQGIERVDGCSAKGISAMVKGAPAPVEWVNQPLRSNWLTDPLVLDSAFQLMILWSFERFNSGSLPCFAGRYRQFSESFPREGAQVVIRVTSERAHGATADMEFLDRHNGKLIARLEDYECVIDPSLEQAFQRNQLQHLGAA